MLVLGGAMAIAACDGDADALLNKTYGEGGDAGADVVTDPVILAENLFRELYPELDKACGEGCHAEGVSGGNPPRFLAKPDPYRSIREASGLVIADPSASRLVNKGAHAGPALEGDLQGLRDKVTRWLLMEAAALQEISRLPGTEPFTVADGANTVDVSKVGTGIDGTKITFTATRSSSVLTLLSLNLVAPAGTGVHLANPVFVQVTPEGKQIVDPVDSFSNVDQKVAAGQTQPIGPGSLILTDFKQERKLRILFRKIEPTTVAGDAGTGGGGCKSPNTFIASAKPQLQNTGCVNCHRGQNAGATAALDLSQLGTNDVAACAQALNKVNLTNKPQSPIIQVAIGGQQHPFTIQDVNARNAYPGQMLNWINNE
jgi:hypothetical protein